MKMNFKHLLASSLTLALVGCNLAAPVSQTAPIKASNAELQALKNPSSIAALQTLKAKRQGFPQVELEQLSKPSLDYQGTRSIKGATESIAVKVAMPAEMKTLFASYQDLKYIKVEVSGKITPDELDEFGNLVTPGETGTFTQDGDEFMMAEGQFATATVSGIPIVDGALRIIKVWGYDANKEALPSFSTSGYYFSEATELLPYEEGQTPDVEISELNPPSNNEFNPPTESMRYGINLGRQHMLMAKVLEELEGQYYPMYDDSDPATVNPTYISLLRDNNELEDLQSGLLYAMLYNPLTHFQFDDTQGYYGRFMFNTDPTNFNASNIVSKIKDEMDTNSGALFQSAANFVESNDLAEWAYLNARSETSDTGSLYIDFANDDNYDGSRYLGEDLYIMINDPTSKPVHVPIGTGADDESFEIMNVAPGDWTLKVVNAAGDVLMSREVTSDEGVNINGSSDLWVDGVKELRPVNVNIATPNYANMMKRNQKIQLSFSVANHEQIVVECDERNDFEAWVPTGDVNIYARTNNGTLIGETTMTVGYDKETFTQAESPMMLDESVESADEFFVNSDRGGINVGTKTAASSNGDYVVVWFKNHHGNDHDFDVMGLYARLYNADGTPKGDEFQALSVNDMHVGSDVPYALAAESLFDVGMDGDGRFVITWGADADDDDNVYAQVFYADGSPKYPVPFQVHEESNGDQNAPSVAVQNDGRYVITWTDDYDYETDDGNPYDGDTTHIRGNLFDLDSALETNEFQVSTDDLWDNENDLSRVSMNANGEFAVSWLNGDPYSDGEVTLYARTFDADGVPIVADLPDNGTGSQPIAYLSQPSDNNGNFIEDSGVIEVTHIDTMSFFQTMDVGDSNFDGSLFLAGGEEMFLPFLSHDIAMDDKFDANFVVTWINPGEPEVDNAPQTPGVYARYFYEETEEITVPSTTTVPTYKRTALQDVSDHENFFSIVGESERTWGEHFAMSPTIDMNNSEYIISWGSVQSPVVDMQGGNDQYSYEHFHELFFSWAARRETNASVQSRRYFRPGGSGVLWTADAIKQLNTCPLPPVMLFQPNGWDIQDLYREEGDTAEDLYHGVFAAYPKPSVSLTDDGVPIAAWHNNDLFPDILSYYTSDWGDGDFGGTDISGRILNNFNL